jgi:sigma-B regulation protein RsbU (phosphoserine phosphatase)
MNAMMLKVLLVEACERHKDPAELLEFINERLAGVCRTGGFVSMFVARFDPQQMLLQYANAGHESGVLLPAKGELTELPSTGMVLGVRDGEVWETQSWRLRPGDRLLLATDGVTEAMNGDGRMFGRKRLAEQFAVCRNTEFRETLSELRAALAEHCDGRPYSDDVTMLLLEAAPSETSEMSRRWPDAAHEWQTHSG